MSDSELDRLRALAEAATPGPWEWEAPSGASWPQGDESLVTAYVPDGEGHRETVLYGWGYDASGIDGTDEDRAHIAAFDPPTVLALLDRLEAAEADRDATLDRLSEMTRQKWAAEDAVGRVRALVPVVRFDEEPPRTEMLLRREVVIALDQPAPTTPGGDA